MGIDSTSKVSKGFCDKMCCSSSLNCFVLISAPFSGNSICPACTAVPFFGYMCTYCLVSGVQFKYHIDSKGMYYNLTKLLDKPLNRGKTIHSIRWWNFPECGILFFPLLAGKPLNQQSQGLRTTVLPDIAAWHPWVFLGRIRSFFSDDPFDTEMYCDE